MVLDPEETADERRARARKAVDDLRASRERKDEPGEEKGPPSGQGTLWSLGGAVRGTAGVPVVELSLFGMSQPKRARGVLRELPAVVSEDVGPIWERLVDMRVGADEEHLWFLSVLERELDVGGDWAYEELEEVEGRARELRFMSVYAELVEVGAPRVRSGEEAIDVLRVVYLAKDVGEIGKLEDVEALFDMASQRGLAESGVLWVARLGSGNSMVRKWLKK